jgi:hypothetical protein
MAPFTRKKSKKDRAAKAAKKTAKNAAKGVAIVEVAKRAPKKRISLIAGGIVAALVATKIVRGRHGDPAAA